MTLRHLLSGSNGKGRSGLADAILSVRKATTGRHGGTKDNWPIPKPISELPAVEEFDLSLLPNILRVWISDVSERMQCPPDFAAVGAIVALGALIGRQLSIRPMQLDDWEVCPNLWGVIIGRPGLLKSPAMKQALSPLAPLEKEAEQEYAEAQKKYADEVLLEDLAREEARRAVKDALKCGRDKAMAAAEQPVSTPAPTMRRYKTNDPTVEKLGEILNQNPNGVLVFRDEITGFLKSFERDGRESDRDFYKEAWVGNGTRYDYDRVSRGHISIEAPCVSVLGTTQPGPWSKWVGRAQQGGLDGDGLIQRFQLAVWPDESSNWTCVDRTPDFEAFEEVCEVFRRLSNIDLSAVGATEPHRGLPHLRFTPIAQERLNSWRSDIELSLRADGMPESLQAHLSKYRSLVPSLALIFHLVDGEVGSVGETSVLRATAWAQYLESHAGRIYSPAVCPVPKAANLMLQRIRDGALGAEFNSRELNRKKWSGLTDSKVNKEALRLLEQNDWLRESSSNSGASWLVNPHALSTTGTH